LAFSGLYGIISQKTGLFGKIIHFRNRSLLKSYVFWVVSINVNIPVRYFSCHVPSVICSGSSLERAILNVRIEMTVYLSHMNIHKVDRFTWKNK
jgi:hypothetical protein